VGKNTMLLIVFSFFCSFCGNGYPCFEISAVNADKPPLSVSQIKDRIKQFEKAGEAHYLIVFTPGHHVLCVFVEGSYFCDDVAITG